VTIVVAVTDSPEGRAALEYAAREARQLDQNLVAVNLTNADLDTATISDDQPYEVVVPESNELDEVEVVLQVLDGRTDISRLVVGVRKRSPVGKAVFGSIAQRLILEAPLPVLAVKARARE
jgi:nucleotide-binding universal stress UspA family protein